MGSYKIRWKKSATKELRKIHKKSIPKIISVVEHLASNPLPPGSKKLAGSESLYRLRSGEYRIIYKISESNQLVEIIRVRHRKDIYR